MPTILTAMSQLCCRAAGCRLLDVMGYGLSCIAFTKCGAALTMCGMMCFEHNATGQKLCRLSKVTGCSTHFHAPCGSALLCPQGPVSGIWPDLHSTDAPAHLASQAHTAPEHSSECCIWCFLALPIPASRGMRLWATHMLAFVRSLRRSVVFHCYALSPWRHITGSHCQHRPGAARPGSRQPLSSAAARHRRLGGSQQQQHSGWGSAYSAELSLLQPAWRGV